MRRSRHARASRGRSSGAAMAPSPPPGAPVLSLGQVSVGGDQRAHTGCARGLHVAFRVSHVKTGCGRCARKLRRLQHRHRMRLALAQGIAADHARELLAEPQLFQQRLGEPPGLVGDDAEGDAPCRELGEYRIHSGEEPRSCAECGGVDLQKAPLQGGQPLDVGIRKSEAHQAPRPVAHRGAGLLEGQRPEAVLAA